MTKDRKLTVKYDEISEKVLNSVPKQNRKFVEKQLELLNSSFLDYIVYWNEKYYRNGSAIVLNDYWLFEFIEISPIGLFLF